MFLVGVQVTRMLRYLWLYESKVSPRLDTQGDDNLINPSLYCIALGYIQSNEVRRPCIGRAKAGLDYELGFCQRAFVVNCGSVLRP